MAPNELDLYSKIDAQASNKVIDSFIPLSVDVLETFMISFVRSLGTGLPLAQGGGGGSIVGLLPLMAILGLMFYFMIFRPQKRDQEQVRQMQSNLKKNDHVETVGGIYGTIVNAHQGSPYVTIKVDESTNAKLRVKRGSIARIVTDEDGQAGTESTTLNDKGL